MKVNAMLEMMEIDYAENINHYDLQIENDIIKQGFNLPNRQQLHQMYLLHKQGIGGFKNDWYMTSEPGAGSFVNYCINFETGEELLRNIEESHWGCCRVRLVKLIS
jgi:hypothetical protein